MRTTFLLASLLLGCRQPPAPTVSSDPRVTVSTLPVSLLGLSGLTVDDTGRLWSVLERTPALVPLRLDGAHVVQDGEPLPIGRWLPNVDAESIAWVGRGPAGEGQFVLGAEPRFVGARAEDKLVRVDVRDDAAAVRPVGGVVDVVYAPFQTRGEANRGLEGVAVTPAALYAAAETVLLPATGGREAPLWRIARTDEAVTTARLRLTSETGKISDLAARETGDTTRILAIERHYGVSSLVVAEVTWGTADVPSTATARVVRDLAGVLAPVPNLEGLAWLPDGRVVLVADNDSGEAPGLVTVLVIEGLTGLE
ncbi:MAG: esterase-like activity of phytase family protein [Pseudomonadota bacterium]|nr:esterase-like activity of phytase family protein [Pseudomonadota bacterium]